MNIANKLKNVMSLVAEAEVGALSLNSRQAIPARMTLIEMRHQQPPTSIQVDNTTALGFVGNNITPKATTSTDIIFGGCGTGWTKSSFAITGALVKVTGHITGRNMFAKPVTEKKTANNLDT